MMCNRAEERGRAESRGFRYHNDSHGSCMSLLIRLVISFVAVHIDSLYKKKIVLHRKLDVGRGLVFTKEQSIIEDPQLQSHVVQPQYTCTILVRTGPFIQ